MRQLDEQDLPIRTERLVIRRLTGRNTPALVAYRSLPEICRFLPWAPMDARVIAKRIDAWSRLLPDETGSPAPLAVEADGVLVGDVGLFVSGDVRDETLELGWILSADHEGHGYATEAARGLLALAFDVLHAHRVVARMNPRNGPSAAVAARLGMRREALMIENELMRGEWVDTLTFALLDREYRTH